jgi:hypothetical protein
MALDTSIYQNVGSIRPVEVPSFAETAGNAMKLSQMGLQNQQMQRTIANQQAMREAYAQSTGPNGQLDESAYLSRIGKIDPQLAMEQRGSLAKVGKESADAQAAKMAALHQTVSAGLPYLQQALKMPDDQASQMWPQHLQQMKSVGLPIENLPQQWNRDAVKANFDRGNQYKEALENRLTQSTTAKNYAEADKTRSETIQKTPESLAGGDPAKLIAGRVPKDLQAKAFEEVKSAKEINALAPQIEAAFQMASSRNPNTSANGKKQLAALLYTTVKETEGTSRKQAFDAIDDKMIPSGLLARPGENESKLETIGKYLQSKSSYPITGGHGIELSKYASTTPYRMGSGIASAAQPASASREGGRFGNQTANAAASLPPPPQGMIRMRSPDGKVGLLPISQKGEAIAAGGSVVQ